MALYLPDRNALFLHIPKCGGFWVQEALLRVGLAIQHIPAPDDPTRADRHATSNQAGTDADLVFTFVRHPLDWYASWWRYQAGQPHNWDRWAWHPIHELQGLRCSDFNRWVDIVTAKSPGVLTRLYERYTGPFGDPAVGFVGRTECLLQDFCRVMAAIDWPDYREALRELPPQNRSGSRLGQPVWKPEQEEAVLESEHEIIAAFYAEKTWNQR